jgi:hypothetical protein
MNRYHIFLKEEADLSLFKEELDAVGIKVIAELRIPNILTVETNDNSIFNHSDVEDIIDANVLYNSNVKIFENYTTEGSGVHQGQMATLLGVAKGKSVSDTYSNSEKLVDTLFRKLKGETKEKKKKISAMLRYGQKAGKNKSLFDKALEYIKKRYN